MSSIGKCVGCGVIGRLEGDACTDCISMPSRGRKFLELARRVRMDPAFALACYKRIKNENSRRIFVEKYGLPEGADAAPIEILPEPKLAKVIQFRPRTKPDA